MDATVSITDNVVAVAGLSGQIGAVHFNPNRHLGKIGSHHVSAAEAAAAAAVDDEEEETAAEERGAGSSLNGTPAPTSSKAPIDSLALNFDGSILVKGGSLICLMIRLRLTNRL